MLTQAGAWKVVIPVAVHRDHREVGQKMESKALVVKIFCSLVDIAHGLWMEGRELGAKPEVEQSPLFCPLPEAHFRLPSCEYTLACAQLLFSAIPAPLLRSHRYRCS